MPFVYCASKAVKQLSKLFEIRNKNTNTVYCELVTSFLDESHLIASQCVQNSSDDSSATLLANLISILFKNVNIDIFEPLLDAKRMRNWVLIMLEILTIDLPSKLLEKPADMLEARSKNKHPLWKMKIKSFEILYKIVTKVNFSKTGVNDELISLFVEEALPKIVDLAKNYLALSKQNYVPDMIGCTIYKMFGSILHKNIRVDFFQQTFLDILYNLTVFDAFLTQEDIQNFQSNEKKFVNTQNDQYDYFFIKRFACSQFLKALCCFKTENNENMPTLFFEPIYEFLINALKECFQKLQNKEEFDLLILESTLFLFEAIIDEVYMKRVNDIDEIHQIIFVPLLKSDAKVIKYRILSILRVSIPDSHELSIEETNLILMHLSDNSLPLIVGVKR